MFMNMTSDHIGSGHEVFKVRHNHSLLRDAYKKLYTRYRYNCHFLQGHVFFIDIKDGGVLQRYMADHALTLGALVIEQLTPQTTHVIVTHMGQPIIKDIDSWPYASPRPEAVSVQWFYASCGTTNLSSSIHPVRKDIRYIISTGIQACVRQHEN